MGSQSCWEAWRKDLSACFLPSRAPDALQQVLQLELLLFYEPSSLLRERMWAWGNVRSQLKPMTDDPDYSSQWWCYKKKWSSVKAGWPALWPTWTTVAEPRSRSTKTDSEQGNNALFSGHLISPLLMRFCYNMRKEKGPKPKHYCD